MLRKLPDPICGCLDRAALAQRRAAEASDPAVRHDYEQIARDWQNLAASYELTESLEHFIIAIEQMKEAARTAPTMPFPHGPGASPARRAGGAAAADVLPALRAARAHR